jgi:hypothetical protein
VDRYASATVARRVSANGGHPTGTTAAATGSRINETASPKEDLYLVTCSASAFACRNGKAALWGRRNPALFTNILLMFSRRCGLMAAERCVSGR